MVTKEMINSTKNKNTMYGFMLRLEREYKKASDEKNADEMLRIRQLYEMAGGKLNDLHSEATK